MKKKVFFAIPSLLGKINARTFISLLHDELELCRQGIDCVTHVREQDSNIANARNVLIGTFLASDCTDLIFVDDDVDWEAGGVPRLLAYPVDFVAGAYRHKKDEESYPVNFPNCDLWSNDLGLLEVESVPFGFVRLTRQAITKISITLDETYECHDTPGVVCYPMCEIQFKPGLPHGEDFHFCRLWREMGGKIYLDPEMTLGHTGQKRYAGHIGNWLKST